MEKNSCGSCPHNPHKLIAKSIMSPHENTNTSVQWELTGSRAQWSEWQPPRLASTPKHKIPRSRATRQMLRFSSQYRLTRVSGSSITSLASERAPANKLSEGMTAREGFIGEADWATFACNTLKNAIIPRYNLTTVHCHKVKHYKMLFFVMFCLWARAEWLKVKNQHEDDDDKAPSHSANESPDLPRVCPLCKFLFHTSNESN